MLKLKTDISLFHINNSECTFQHTAKRQKSENSERLLIYLKTTLSSRKYRNSNTVTVST